MLKLKYWELHVAVYLKKDLEQKHSYEHVANLVKFCSNNDDYLKEKHLNGSFKNSCISSLYPTFKDMLYKKDCIYNFINRSNDYESINRLQKQIEKQNNDWFVVVKTEIKEQDSIQIKELQTYTPGIMTLKDCEIPESLKSIKHRSKFWIQDCSKKILIDRIESNLKKKYKAIYGEDIGEVAMIKNITIRNKKPIVMKYKGSCAIGNKFNIEINQDIKSQKLANLALITGILEKNNSLCAGFCKGVY